MIPSVRPPNRTRDARPQCPQEKARARRGRHYGAVHERPDRLPAPAARTSRPPEVIAVEPRRRGHPPGSSTTSAARSKLIASENYASPAVLLTMGTWFRQVRRRHRRHRFYAGCQNVDTVEALAAEHAASCSAPLRLRPAALGHRRQPGGLLGDPGPPGRGPGLATLEEERQRPSEADQGEVFRNELGQPAAAGMSLTPAGTLTHGFRPEHQRQDVPPAQLRHRPETGLIDYDAVAAAAREFKPLVLVAGYSAYPRRVNFAKMRDRRRGRRHPDGRHGALRGPGRGQGVHRRRGPGAHAHVTTTTTHWRRGRGGLVAGHRGVRPGSTAAARWCSAVPCRT